MCGGGPTGGRTKSFLQPVSNTRIAALDVQNPGNLNQWGLAYSPRLPCGLLLNLPQAR